MSRIEKCIETERRLVVAMWLEKGVWGVATNVDGASLGYYENVVKLNGDDGCTILTIPIALNCIHILKV